MEKKTVINLKEILKSRGMSQAEFSRLSGMDTHTISRLAGNCRGIQLDTIDTICNTLAIEPGELLVRK